MEGPENYLSSEQVAIRWGLNQATFWVWIKGFLSDGSLKAYVSTPSGYRELHYPEDFQRPSLYLYFKKSDIERLEKEKGIERESYLSSEEVGRLRWGVNLATFEVWMRGFLSDGRPQTYELTPSGWRELHYPEDYQRTQPRHVYFKESDLERVEKEKGIERKDKPKDRQLSSETPLNGKRAIAAYLGLAGKNYIKTVDIYIKKGMKVHQPTGSKGPIYAYPSEINEWIRTKKKK